MKLRIGQLWNAVKVAMKVEQGLEKVGIIPENKIDDKIVKIVEAVEDGRKESGTKD